MLIASVFRPEYDFMKKQKNITNEPKDLQTPMYITTQQLSGTDFFITPIYGSTECKDWWAADTFATASFKYAMFFLSGHTG